MNLSDSAKKIIHLISSAGYEAYAVGGCVRDFLMQRPCDDIDITTSATPDELENILSDNHIKFIETGIKHGTVTAVPDDGSVFEITTFRTEGAYSDSRHPESVSFVTDINEDLSRRDFTINAIAYNDEQGFVDPYGGQDDIDLKIIRAVGDADTRFKEDALRIMRAVRFASVLGFDIENKTKKALFVNKMLLKNISAERIYTELSKLLMGDNVYNILVEYKEIMAVIIPELEPIFYVEQNTRWHIYDVWHHTAKSVEQAPEDLALRYTMLLHDIGKAYSKTTDENGTDHFKGHQKISGEYALTALKRLKAPNEVLDRAMAVIPIHDMHIGIEEKNIKKWLSRLGENTLRDLIAVKRADKSAQNPKMIGDELARLAITEEKLNAIIAAGEPFAIKDLAVNGNDIMALGYQGREIGAALNAILEKVIDGELQNDREIIVEFLTNFKL